MNKAIIPNLETIEEYFKLKKGEYFKIPPYQREYAWSKDKCEKLWQDICNRMDSKKKKDPYFFGTVITDISKKNETSLIDGQQRTTTFILLLKAVLLRIDETLPNIPKTSKTQAVIDGLVNSRDKILDILYKIDIRSVSSYYDKDTFLRKKNFPTYMLIKNNSINEAAEFLNDLSAILKSHNLTEAQAGVYAIPKKKLPETKYSNYFNNFSFFYNTLLDNLSESSLDEFAECLLVNCQVIKIETSNEEQAITMFNSLNSDGLPLADANIISSWLYEKGVSKFDTKWKTFKKMADKLKEQNIVNIDSILTQFMYINRAMQGEKSVTLVGVRSYYKNEKWEKSQFLLTDKPIELIDRLTDLANAWETVKEYESIWLALKFNDNIKHFIGSFFARFDRDASGDLNIGESDIKPFAEVMIKLFTILSVVETGYSSKNFKQFLFVENLKIVNKNVSVSDIVKGIEDHISANWKKDEIKTHIATFNNTKELQDANEGNVLVYLNDYLYAKEKSLSLPFKSSINIEHILPQSGRNLITIRKNANLLNNDDFALRVNSVGNKILLEESINKKIGNEVFTDKIQTTIPASLGYKDSKFPLAQALLLYKSKNGKQEWTKKDIDEANAKAAERIANFIFNS